MNKYEVLYILENAASDEFKKEFQAKIENVITSAGGTVSGVDIWGTKRYAYQINSKNEGFYVLITAEAPASVPAEIERQVRITAEAVRVMVTVKE